MTYKICRLMDDAEDDLLAHMAFPSGAPEQDSTAPIPWSASTVKVVSDLKPAGQASDL